MLCLEFINFYRSPHSFEEIYRHFRMPWCRHLPGTTVTRELKDYTDTGEGGSKLRLSECPKKTAE